VSGNAVSNGLRFHPCLDSLPSMEDGDLVLLRTNGDDISMGEKAAVWRTKSIATEGMHETQVYSYLSVAQSGVPESKSSRG